MQQAAENDIDVHPIIDALEGTNCPFCDNGTLVRSVYKGNTAVVCDACDVPGAQVW